MGPGQVIVVWRGRSLLPSLSVGVWPPPLTRKMLLFPSCVVHELHRPSKASRAQRKRRRGYLVTFVFHVAIADNFSQHLLKVQNPHVIKFPYYGFPVSAGKVNLWV